MGIQGLLQLLKPLTQQEHLSSFKDQKIGIDAFPWLYKGCYMHYATLDIENDQKITPSCSNYFLLMLDLMNTYNIKPYFVFDGRSLSMKKGTIAKRNDARQSNQDLFNELREKKQWQEARKYLTRTIRVTQEIICEALTVLKLKNIDFIVSPYETDSQLSWLWVNGKIDSVITEDSDLILYGCKKIIYKLSEEGQCQYLDLSEEIKNVDSTYLESWMKLSKVQQIQTSVMAGCDYLPSIRGIGLKKAVKFMEECGSLPKVVEKLQKQASFKQRIPQNYLQSATNASLIFQYALIFNIQKMKFQHFNKIPAKTLSLEQIKLFGEQYPQYIDMKVYSGETEPRKMTKIQIDSNVRIQSSNQVKTLSLKQFESKNSERKKMRKKIEEQKEDQVDFNMIEAMQTLRRPVTIQEFWKNQVFSDLMNSSLAKILTNI